jgi:hypothetical protein
MGRERVFCQGRTRRNGNACKNRVPVGRLYCHSHPATANEVTNLSMDSSASAPVNASSEFTLGESRSATRIEVLRHLPSFPRYLFVESVMLGFLSTLTLCTIILIPTFREFQLSELPVILLVPMGLADPMISHLLLIAEIMAITAIGSGRGLTARNMIYSLVLVLVTTFLLFFFQHIYKVALDYQKPMDYIGEIYYSSVPRALCLNDICIFASVYSDRLPSGSVMRQTALFLAASSAIVINWRRAAIIRIAPWLNLANIISLVAVAFTVSHINQFTAADILVSILAGMLSFWTAASIVYIAISHIVRHFSKGRVIVLSRGLVVNVVMMYLLFLPILFYISRDRYTVLNLAFTSLVLLFFIYRSSPCEDDYQSDGEYYYV